MRSSEAVEERSTIEVHQYNIVNKQLKIKKEDQQHSEWSHL